MNSGGGANAPCVNQVDVIPAVSREPGLRRESSQSHPQWEIIIFKNITTSIIFVNVALRRDDHPHYKFYVRSPFEFTLEIIVFLIFLTN